MVQMLLSIVLFWFLTIFITQDHKIDLLTAGIWTVLAAAIPTLILTLSYYVFHTEQEILLLVLALLVQSAVLTFALRYRFYVTNGKQLATILVSYFIGSVLIGLLLG